MNTFVMTIGPPGIGKSTVVEKAEAAGWFVVSPDRIRKEITGRTEDVSRDGEVWVAVYQRIEKALDYENRGKNIILDATGANGDLRRRMIAFVRSIDPVAIIEGWVFDGRLSTAFSRNAARERKVPPNVIHKMARALWEDPPTTKDGFWFLTYYDEDGTKRKIVRA